MYLYNMYTSTDGDICICNCDAELNANIVVVVVVVIVVVIVAIEAIAAVIHKTERKQCMPSGRTNSISVSLVWGRVVKRRLQI